VVHCFLNNCLKIVSGLIFLILIISGDFFPTTADAQTVDEKTSAVEIDAQHIIGRWVRPDGGYVLEFKEIGTDGNLKAGYFNPRSIHVARAELRHNEDAMTIFVELRDINYPGSTYNLIYDPKSDRLIGTYFQAVDKVTYDIQFIRGN
jgi:hypothetical protein